MLGTYAGNYYSGKPGLTAHPFGRGMVYSFGAVFSEATVRRFAALLDLECPEPLELPDAVELAVRESADGKRYVFLLNYTDAPQVIHVRDGKAYADLLTGRILSGEPEMEPYGVLVLEAHTAG